jgi:hypothetical protein
VVLLREIRDQLQALNAGSGPSNGEGTSGRTTS